MANSKRVKFYIKQIPVYEKRNTENDPFTLRDILLSLFEDSSLSWGLDQLERFSSREKTGHEAIDFLKFILETVESDSANIIERVIEKDCKIGFGTRMINKVFPDLIEKVGYLGAKPYSEKLVRNILKSNPINFSQEKMDGRGTTI